MVKFLVLKQSIMFKVLYSLVPILLFSIYLFGLRVLAVVAVSNIAAFLTEWLFTYRKKKKISSAVFVSGSLLALTLPPTIPFWMAAVGSVVAISFGKMVFGGFGMNIFNPAIVGRAFLYVAFAQEMTIDWIKPLNHSLRNFLTWQDYSLITRATPMRESLYSLQDKFLGFIPGSIGETSALLIIMSGLYLFLTKTAKWQPAVATLLSFIFFSAIFYPAGEILGLLFSGGIIFGSVFMITDPVSMPKEKVSIWIYGILVGFLTVFIRKYSLWIEGFMFALILANSFMPIVEYGILKIRSK